MSGKTFFYKGVRVNAFGIPISILDSGSKKSYIKKDGRKRTFYHINFKSEYGRNSPKNLIVMYDIPHEKKKERDWFRRQLKNFHYIMIQKSVWVGPSPLPKDFVEYVKLVGLKDKLKTFKLDSSYNGKGDGI
ncbi:MAG: CRISPR-associated endonuclease Cas2 [Parcubacteria group bacterium]